MEEILKEDLSKNKKLSPEFKNRINKILRKNVLIILAILIYIGIIGFAYYKLELNTFSTDLKVLSTAFALVAILKLEKGYKQDSEGIFLVGVELLIFAFITLFMTDFIEMEEAKFLNIIKGISISSVIYYLAKAMISKRKVKKEHKEQISDVRDIIKKKGEI